MSFKINDSHWNVLIEFMSKHPQFARGQFVGPAGKSTQRKLWEQLATELNSLGYGAKSVEKWQKTWADIKYVIKKKAAATKSDLNQTGGGPASGKRLNDYEERILGILGKTFAEGVGSSECGLHGVPSCSQSQVSNRGQNDYSDYFSLNAEEEVATVQQEFLDIDMEGETGIDITAPRTVENTPYLPSNSSTKDNRPSTLTAPRTVENKLSLPCSSSTKVNRPSTLTAVPNPQDHLYTQKIKRPLKKPTAEEIENAMYKETVDELKSIKEGVFKISDNLSEINLSLKEIKNVLLSKQ